MFPIPKHNFSAHKSKDDCLS